MVRIPEGSAPDFKNKSWTVAAEMAIPENGASGVLAKLGGRFGGWGLLMQDSKPEFVYAFSNQTEHKFRVASSQPITPGNHVVRVAFRYDGGGGYPTLLKSALFSVVLACCKILEEAAVGLYHRKSFSQSIADLGGGTLKGILTLTLLLFVLLVPFFGFGELQRVLGEGKLTELFFHRRNVSAVAKPQLV